MINYAAFRCIYTLTNAALLFFIIVLTTHDSLIDFLFFLKHNHISCIWCLFQESQFLRQLMML